MRIKPFINFRLSVIGILFAGFLLYSFKPISQQLINRRLKIESGKPITEVYAEVNSSVTTNVSSQGGGSTSVSVQNNVTSSNSSSTSVSKHIEINVNGQKKVIDSNQPGNTSVQVQSSGPNATPTIVITETPATPSATGSPTVSPIITITPPSSRQINNLIQQLVNNVRRQIEALLRSLRF